MNGSSNINKDIYTVLLVQDKAKNSMERSLILLNGGRGSHSSACFLMYGMRKDAKVVEFSTRD